MLPATPFCVLALIIVAPRLLIRWAVGRSSPPTDYRRRGAVPIVAPIIPHPRRLCQVPPPPETPKTAKSRTFTGEGGKGGGGQHLRFRKKHGAGQKQIDPTVSVCSFLLPCYLKRERSLSLFGRVYNPLSLPLLFERRERDCYFLCDSRLYIPP